MLEKSADNVAVVTGAASGIGRATTMLLAQAGFRIMMLDIVDDAARSLIEDLGPERVAFMFCDVTSENEIRLSMEASIDTFGSIDHLVNCAGASGTGGPIELLSLEDFQRTMQLLVTSQFLATKYAVPHMKVRSGGSIVNVASIAGLLGAPDNVAYSAAKAAVIGLTRASAGQLAEFNIRVNAVAPGYTVTPIFDKLLDWGDTPPEKRLDELRSRFAAIQPLKRAGEAVDIAESIVFLLGDSARFITGEILVVDGGLTALLPKR